MQVLTEDFFLNFIPAVQRIGTSQNFALEKCHISILPTTETSIVRFSRYPRHPLGKVKNTAFSRFLYMSCAIPLPLAAIKIVSRHKVVCAQNLMFDSRLLTKQYKFCEKQKELTDEFKGRSYFISLSEMFPKSPKVLTKISNFPTRYHRESRHRHRNPPPPHHHHHHHPSPNVQLAFLVGKTRYVRLPLWKRCSTYARNKCIC